MSYISLSFLIFVVLLMIIYYVLPKKIRWIAILLGNIVFFLSLSGKLIIYVFLASLVAFFSAQLINKYGNHKKKIVLLSILTILSFLAILKYNNFISSLINPIINIFGLNIPYMKFIMPIGISYYSLEMIAYVVDVYRKKTIPEKNFLKLFTFFTYFPKIIEGPICRYNDLKEKIFSDKKFDYEKIISAWVLIGYGFMKKLIIADRLGIFVDNVFKNSYTGIPAIMAIIMYTMQIYCDFSGYIDIISGVSELFDIKLPNNFRRPFFSQSIQEFWRRWHITLGEWLKDYIFYPISLSKMNMKLNLFVRKIKFKHLSKFIIIAFPLFFVWFVNGLWHGASVKYILYGLYYYVLMMLGVLLKPVLDKIVIFFKINTNVWSFKLFRILRTILIVCIGMLLFRSENINQFLIMFKGLFSISMDLSISQLGLKLSDFLISGFFIVIIFCIELSCELGVNIREKLNEQNLLFRWIVYLLIIFSILIFGIYGRGYAAKSFIYGGF